MQNQSQAMFPWLESAKRWLPKRVENLRITGWFSASSPVVVDECCGLTIEGALQYLVVAIESRCMPDDAFAEVRQHVEIPVPIADVEIEGRRIACASWGVLFDATGGTRYRRRRTRAELMRTPGGKGVLGVTDGELKALNIPIATKHAAYVEFFVRGDKEKIAKLLSSVGVLGRDRGRGLGVVSEWEIEPVDADLSVWVDEWTPARSIPVSLDEQELWESRNVAIEKQATRAPYWHHATRTLCLVPPP